MRCLESQGALHGARPVEELRHGPLAVVLRPHPVRCGTAGTAAACPGPAVALLLRPQRELLGAPVPPREEASICFHVFFRKARRDCVLSQGGSRRHCVCIAVVRGHGREAPGAGPAAKAACRVTPARTHNHGSDLQQDSTTCDKSDVFSRGGIARGNCPACQPSCQPLICIVALE